VATEEPMIYDDQILRLVDMYSTSAPQMQNLTTEAGSDLSVADILKGVEAYINKNAMIQVDRNSDAEMPFRWTFSESIPKPEDYVLSRNRVKI
jgi:hypothetical protein